MGGGGGGVPFGEHWNIEHSKATEYPGKISALHFSYLFILVTFLQNERTTKVVKDSVSEYNGVTSTCGDDSQGRS